jgi:quercetin dioxygenase-like cupin family protein
MFSGDGVFEVTIPEIIAHTRATVLGPNGSWRRFDVHLDRGYSDCSTVGALIDSRPEVFWSLAMNELRLQGLIGAIVLLIPMLKGASAELEPACAVNSPERRGEIGCSLVEDKPLPETLKEPLFWHIDRFDSGERARSAVGSTSIAFEAHGTWWLMTIESRIEDHHGGQHVTQVGLPPLPKAAKYSMLAMSAYIPAGLTSRVHHHSGVEGFYVVDGEQCLETAERSYKMLKGDTLVIPAGVTMQLVATGSTPRRALAVIVYDAAQPPTTRMEHGPPLVSCN